MVYRTSMININLAHSKNNIFNLKSLLNQTLVHNRENLKLKETAILNKIPSFILEQPYKSFMRMSRLIIDILVDRITVFIRDLCPHNMRVVHTVHSTYSVYTRKSLSTPTPYLWSKKSRLVCKNQG